MTFINEQHPLEQQKDQDQDQTILDRYRRAEALEHEMYNSSMVLNAQVYPHWIHDSDCFWYIRKNRQAEAAVDNITTEYILVNAGTATHTKAFDHERLAQALAQAAKQDVNPNELPISELDLELSPTRATFMAFDKRWRFDASTETCEAMASHEDQVAPDGLLSPDAKKAVFIRDYNLWIRNLENGEEQALTQNGEQHYAYAVEPEGRDLIKGLTDIESYFSEPLEAIWSPDSSKLFTFQMDERPVRDIPSMLYVPQDGTIAPKVIERKFALSGDEQVAQYRMLIIDIETATEIAVHYPPIDDACLWYSPFSGNRAWWSGDGRRAYFIDMTRGQKTARLIALDAETGMADVLFEESAETYLELSLDFEHPYMLTMLPDTDELIWYSERTGWAHLYLYDLTTGELKTPITTGEWRVRDIVHFDKDTRELFIQIAGRVQGRNPYYRELVRVNVDSGAMTVLASGDCDYRVCRRPGVESGLSPSCLYIVTTQSRVDAPSVTELRDRNGELLLTVEAADISGLPSGWRWPESVTMKADDGKTDIFGVLFRPSDFDPAKKYPVLDIDTISPAYSLMATGAFLLEDIDPTGNLMYTTLAALAELGFIVTLIEGRGTPHRSKSFHDFGYTPFMEGSGIIDHVAGIKQLAKRYPYMDLNNVGVTSFDGAGNGSIFGLLHHSNFYKVGVAFSMWDPRFIKQGEVFHGLVQPSDHQQSIWSDAVNNLQGKLLLVTGLMDAYFHSCMTFQLVDMLVKANKDVDLLIQPNGGHGFRVKNAHRKVWDYLVRHLQGVEPPKNFALKTGFEKCFPGMLPEKVE